MNATDYIQQALDSWPEWYQISRDIARNAINTAWNCDQVRDGIWSTEEARYLIAADNIKEHLEYAVDDLPIKTWRDALVVQLVSSGLGEIDFVDMATFYLERESECAQ